MPVQDTAEVVGTGSEGALDEVAVEASGEDVGGGLAVEAPFGAVRDKDALAEDVGQLPTEKIALDVVVEIC